MFRASSTFAFATVASFITAGSARADDAIGLDAYLKALETAQVSFDRACEILRASSPPEGRVWLRRGAAGIEIAPDSARASEAAAFWAEAALGAHDAATVLYGAALTDDAMAEPVMIESRDGQVMVHDGAQMNGGDACDALHNITRGFGPATGSVNPFDAARDNATDPARIALTIGASATAPIRADLGSDSIARAPDGVLAQIVTGEDGLQMEAFATGEAKPGTATVRLYDPADPFRAVETIDMTILPGPAPAAPPQRGEMALGSSYVSTLPMGGLQDIDLTVSKPQSVTIASTSAADLSAVLETSDGQLIASNDDSGGGYGFSLTADLPPGAYRLRVSHCCGGGGDFVVTTGETVIAE